MFDLGTAHSNVVYVRWRTLVPGSGYDLWDGQDWLPVSRREVDQYLRRGLAVHMNPPWSHRG